MTIRLLLYARKADKPAARSSGVQLDRLDAGILRLLQEDARLSYRQIAEKLGTTTPTVSARVKALEDLGILRGYRAEVDPGIIGGATYLLTVRAAPRSLDKVARDVAALDGVEEVLLVAGGALQARARLRPPQSSLAQLHAALAAMDDVSSYDVAEVLAVRHKRAVHVFPDNVDVACHQCHGPIRGEPVTKTVGGHAHVFCCKHCMTTFVKRFETLEKAK